MDLGQKDIYKTVAILIIVATVFLLYSGLVPLPFSLPACPFHQWTGFHCPFCGAQRAIQSIFQGDIIGVHRANILLIPSILLFFFVALTRKKSWAIHKKSWFSMSIILVLLAFWLLRNLPWFPLTNLAPR